MALSALGGSAPGGGGGLVRGGVCSWGVSGPGGVSAPWGGLPAPGGGVCYRGVSATGGCLLRGVVSAPGGCLFPGGCGVSQYALRQTPSPPPPPVDRILDTRL